MNPNKENRNTLEDDESVDYRSDHGGRSVASMLRLCAIAACAIYLVYRGAHAFNDARVASTQTQPKPAQAVEQKPEPAKTPSDNVAPRKASQWANPTAYGKNCFARQGNATRDPRWKRDLSLEIDHEILDATIVEYQIQWFNGKWSGPYFPGENDVDWKDNGPGNKRRVWSYFYDHNFRYVACRAGQDQ